MNESLMAIEMWWKGVYDDLLKCYDQDGHLLGEAMSYLMARHGKQVRPMICLLVADALSDEPRCGVLPAVSCELVHIYSLIHDDLPAMDNASTRRGVPSLHEAMDEATAILAGDALLSDAFGWLVGRRRHQTSKSLNLSWELSPYQQGAMVRVLAEQIGSQGMVLGQSYDIHSDEHVMSLDDMTECSDLINHFHPSLKTYMHINRLKTGSLFAAALMMGALSASEDLDIDSEIIQTLKRCGWVFGMMYQFADDRCDMMADDSSEDSVAAQLSSEQVDQIFDQMKQSLWSGLTTCADHDHQSGLFHKWQVLFEYMMSILSQMNDSGVLQPT